MTDKKIRFIISRNSGKQSIYIHMMDKIRKAYKHLPKLNVVVTKRENHIVELAKEWADRYGEDGIVYVLGGDGGASEAANALYKTDTYMGLIPTGTGNDFAKTLYGPGDVSEELLDELIANSSDPKFGKVDLLKMNDQVVSLNVISMGFDTIILKRAYKNLDKCKRLGNFAYPLAFLQSLFKDKSFEVEYYFENPEGESIQDRVDATILAVGNGQYYGSGFRPTFKAEIDDGLADFVYADKLSVAEVIPLISKYRDGSYYPHPKFTYFQFNKGYIENISDKQILANFDGRIFNLDRLEIEVLPKALNFAYLK